MYFPKIMAPSCAIERAQRRTKCQRQREWRRITRMQPIVVYPPRANVLGVGVSAFNLDGSTESLRNILQGSGHGYVCVTSVHVVMEAQKDPELLRILNSSLLSTPDGMPTVWVGKLQGFSHMRRVRGLELML